MDVTGRCFQKLERGRNIVKERIKGARPMMDLMAKKIFSNTTITSQFIRDIFDLPVENVKILESTQIHEFYLDEFLIRLILMFWQSWMITR